MTIFRPGKVVTADDCDAWGCILEGRRFVMGNNDTCYKLAGKERDAESLYGYFGARYYKSRIGRFFL